MRWLRRLLGSDDEREATAARQQGDPTVLDRADDPRGGTQSEEYRHADPREIVVEDVPPCPARAALPRTASRSRSGASAIAIAATSAGRVRGNIRLA